MVKILINLTVSGIQASVPDHFEMFLRDMSD